MLPAVFKLNIKRDIVTWFGPDAFDDFTCRYEPEASNFFSSRAVFVLMLQVNRLTLPVMKSGLFVVLRKKGAA